MNQMQRKKVIIERLQQHFVPDYLEVIDESHLHIGHAGSRDGAGHFSIIIQGRYFDSISKLASHRAIYQVLADLIPHEVHAVKISVNPSLNHPVESNNSPYAAAFSFRSSLNII